MVSALSSDYSIVLITTKEELKLVHSLRVEVFVDEQGFSMEDEMDEKDEASDHFLLYSHIAHKAAVPLGTVRYYPAMGKLGRLAIRASGRNLGLGKILVDALEAHIREGKGKAGEYQHQHQHEAKGYVEVVANSQEHAKGFYEKCGYSIDGPIFLEDGQNHVRMIKRIPVASNM